MPIGDEDLSPQMRKAFKEADVILVEYADAFYEQIKQYEIEYTGEVIAVIEAGQTEKSTSVDEKIEHRLGLGKSVLFITENGYPTIAGPGYDYILIARKANRKVTIIPGPSITSTAYVVSGITSRDRSYVAKNFIGKTKDEKREMYSRVAFSGSVVVILDDINSMIDNLEMIVEEAIYNREVCFIKNLYTETEEVRLGDIGSILFYLKSLNIQEDLEFDGEFDIRENDKVVLVIGSLLKELEGDIDQD